MPLISGSEPCYRYPSGCELGNSAMDRRTVILTVGASVLAAPFASHAQKAAKVWRIGFLAGAARPPDGAPPAALRQALQELGYVIDKNVIYTGRWAEGKSERMPGLAAELVSLNVDLLLTFGAPAAEAAKKATSTIPIVIVAAGDAVGTGLVKSFARPGGNITGITDPATELSAKRLGVLKEAVPDATRIAVLWNAGDQAMTLRYREIERAARALHVTVQPLGVREPDDIDEALSTMTRERPDAFFMVSDALTTLNRKRILDFAATHRIPAMYEFSLPVRDGGLMSYGPSLDDMFGRSAAYVDKILKGAKPGALPIEQPTRYYLVVNLKTAKALGLAIPESLLLRADEVIQ
jgi:putative ABC transport system substrate-binding protein